VFRHYSKRIGYRSDLHGHEIIGDQMYFKVISGIGGTVGRSCAQVPIYLGLLRVVLKPKMVSAFGFRTTARKTSPKAGSCSTYRIPVASFDGGQISKISYQRYL
jgi:hypothetical protein